MRTISFLLLLFFFSMFALPGFGSDSAHAQFKKAQPIAEAEADEDDELFGSLFQKRTGYSGSIGLTNRSYTAQFNYIKSVDPDWMFMFSVSITSDNDPNERQTFNFFTGQNFVYDPFTPLSEPILPGLPPFAPKLNSLMLIPLTASVQHRLFRNIITRSFRPFIEAGAGPSLAYIYDYWSGFFDFSQVSFAVGVHAMIGAGAYFGSNPLMLQGISVRYQFSYIPSGVQMLLSQPPMTYFGSISLNLTFGSLFNTL